MSEHGKNILDIIYKQSFSADEVAMWEKMVTDLPDELCADILKCLQVSPKSPRIMTDNLKEKISALRSHDIELWTKVIAQDEKLMKSFV